MLLPAPGATWSSDCADRGVGADLLDRLHRGPPDQPGALLGDPAAVHVGVGLVMLRRQPGPAGQLRGAWSNRVTSPISATNTAPSTGPIPGISCTARVAGVAGQPASGQPGEQVDLEVQVVHQPAQRLRPAPHTAPAASSRSSSSVPSSPNRSVIGTWIPHLASTACTSALQCDAQPDQLGPVPHQLPQLPGRRRRDPRLRQPTHPQQVGQIRGVADVVLHPPVLKRLHPQRMRQMHVRAGRLQRVDRPVPAVGGLQHHLGIRTGPGHHRRQPVDVVDDPHRLQHLARLGRPHESRCADGADRYRRTACPAYSDIRGLLRRET